MTRGNNLHFPKVNLLTKIKRCVIIYIMESKTTIVREAIIDFTLLLKAQSELMLNLNNPYLLLDTLETLDRLVEMDDTKTDIIHHLRCLILEPFLKSNDETNNIATNNVILCGGSGVGKTTLGVILAKLWNSLGLLKHKQKINTPKTHNLEEKVDNVAKDLIKNWRQYLTYINRKYEYITYNLLVQQQIISNVSTNLNELNINYPDAKIDDVLVINQAANNNAMKIIATICDEDETTRIKNNILNLDTKLNSILHPESVVYTKASVFNIYSRADFVEKYIGGTALKTLALLERHRGQVIFIDEAYSLYYGSDDIYGSEALTTLNKFLSENPNDIIVIFGGYEDALNRSIFKAQVGLRRRCHWTFRIGSYSPTGIATIFKQQLEDAGYILHMNVNIYDFFKEHYDSFSYFGGDTLRLVNHCITMYITHHNKDIVRLAMSLAKNDNKLISKNDDSCNPINYSCTASRETQVISLINNSTSNTQIAEQVEMEYLKAKIIVKTMLMSAYNTYAKNIIKPKSTEPPFGIYL